MFTHPLLAKFFSLLSPEVLPFVALVILGMLAAGAFVWWANRRK